MGKNWKIIDFLNSIIQLIFHKTIYVSYNGRYIFYENNSA